MHRRACCSLWYKVGVSTVRRQPTTGVGLQRAHEPRVLWVSPTLEGENTGGPSTRRSAQQQVPRSLSNWRGPTGHEQWRGRQTWRCRVPWYCKGLIRKNVYNLVMRPEPRWQGAKPWGSRSLLKTFRWPWLIIRYKCWYVDRVKRRQEPHGGNPWSYTWSPRNFRSLLLIQ